MHSRLLTNLIDPKSGQPLTLTSPVPGPSEIEQGTLVDSAGHSFPILHGIPRFVPASNYASSFGYQWNKYAELQLDSKNGTTFSKDRFFSITEWPKADLLGARVLDVGCGAGRVSEVVLRAGAHVVAVDLSQAVEACRKTFVLIQTLMWCRPLFMSSLFVLDRLISFTALAWCNIRQTQNNRY